MLDKKNFYINGAWVKPNSSEEINVIDPATENNCAIITLGNKTDVDMAVKAAKDAYGSWAFSSKEERIGLLEKLYENYKKRWADIAEAITLEMVHQKILLQNYKQVLEQVILNHSSDI